MSTRPTTPDDAPAWVQADRACRHAWTTDARWRKAARTALSATLRDVLTRQAEQAHVPVRTPRAQPAHHGEGCNCAPCRKRRGEKPLPTVAQQQQRRRDRRPPVADDAEHRGDWCMSADTLVRFTRLADVDDDGTYHHLLVRLRTEFAEYMDRLRPFAGLDRLLDEHPAWASALIATRLLGRPQGDVAREEGVDRKTIGRRVDAAQTYLVAVHAGEEPRRHPRSRQGTGATLAALGEAAQARHAPTIAEYVRRTLDPL